MSAGDAIESGLARSERVVALRETLDATERGSVWIVGGAVRDALGGRPVADIDLATELPVAGLAKRLARSLSGTAFELSGEHETWRVSGLEGGTVDIAAFRGPGIEGDLRLRDFTANAIAVPVAGGDPIDPTEGIDAIRERRLSVCHPAAFADDPLRLMRAARIAAEHGFAPDEELIALARRGAERAGEPAGERRFAELRAMLSGPDPVRALELLDELELTAVVLPALHGLRGVEQSANHHLDVHAHTMEVLRRWLEVEGELDLYAGDAAPAVAAALAEPLADELTRRDGIRFAAILHDIGKPATRTEQDGLVSFRGHDRVGAEMITELCRELRTSRRFSSYLAALTRHHLVLGFMTHELPLSRRRVWEYLSLTGRESLDVTLLTIADRLSAQGSGVPEQAIQAHLDLAREMIAEAIEIEREGSPEPLLGGAEIAELLGVEGPRIGEAVAELRAAQFAGELDDRDQAVAHLRAWSASTRS
ncbi:MAG TPA: HD domain-containing protein [Solirubrobacterales bacterium]|nr:HD domain-containing protein [Solirubrobacterales bacterium]